MRTALLCLTLSLALGCRSAAERGAGDEPPTPVDLSAWTPERIELPPGFAPDMPAGRESLLFAPGWSKPGAEGFWSYVFLMEIEAVDVDAARLEELFELYFDGLIGAVGQGKPFELPADPAEVSFQRERGTRYAGLVQTYNAFGSGSALTLHMLVDVAPGSATTTLLRVQASPEERGSGAIWSSLAQALASLTFD